MDLFYRGKDTNLTYIKKEIFTLKKIKSKKIKNSLFLDYYQRYSINDYIQFRGDKLLQMNLDDLKENHTKLSKKNFSNILILPKKGYHKLGEKNNTKIMFYRIDCYDFFMYKRDLFVNNVEKYNELILNQKYKSKYFKYLRPNYEHRKEAYINKFISHYIKYLAIHFSRLKLKKSYIDELHKSVLIALKFDLIKPIILLDNLVEKIELFFDKAENQKNILIDDIINESVEDFELYIDSILEKMNSFKDDYNVIEKRVLNDDDLKSINDLKKSVFSE